MSFNLSNAKVIPLEFSNGKDSLTKFSDEKILDVKDFDAKIVESKFSAEKNFDSKNSDMKILDVKTAEVQELISEPRASKIIDTKNISSQSAVDVADTRGVSDMSDISDVISQKSDLKTLPDIAKNVESVYSSELNKANTTDASLDFSDETFDIEKEEIELNTTQLATSITNKKVIDPTNFPLLPNQNINFMDKKVLSSFNEIMGEAELIQSKVEEKGESITHSSSVSALAQRQDIKILNQSVQDMSSNPTFQKWLESVEHQLSHSMKNGLKEIEIQIDPPHLGKLKINFTIEGENTNLQMTVYSQAAKETMDQHLQRLKDQMQDLGYRNSNVELSLSQQDQKSSYQQQQSFNAHASHQELNDTETPALPDINNSITKSVNLVDLFV